MVLLEFLRQFRFGEYAIFDLVASLLGVWLLSALLSRAFLKLGIDIPRLNWLYLTLPISIPIHLLFGSITPMTADFISLEGGYVLKIVIIVLLFLGLKGIKRVKPRPRILSR